MGILVQGAAVILIAWVCAVILLRTLGLSRVTAGKWELTLERALPLRGEAFTSRMGVISCAWGLAVMLTLLLVSAVCCAISNGSVSWAELYSEWSHSDAVHYQNLAKLGYHGYIEDGQHLFLVFFPLYPWTVRTVNYIIGDYAVSGHLVSCAAYIGGCYMLARLVTEDMGWQTARISLTLFSAYPFAFFFAGYFTESLFLFLSVTTFYFIRRRRYLVAGIFGALATLTRMQGMFLVFVAAVEYFASEQPVKKIRAGAWGELRKDLFEKILPIAVMAAGALTYLGLNYSVEHDPFRFLYYQREHWYQYFVPLPKCIATLWDNILNYGDTRLAFAIWLPELAVFAVCLVSILYAARRLPVTWVTYFLICIVINYSISWPLSCGRYIACAFPLPVTIAASGSKYPMVPKITALIFALLQGVYLFAFLSGVRIY